MLNYLVPSARLELAQLSPLPPQDSVSTNFTASAVFLVQKTSSLNYLVVYPSTLIFQHSHSLNMQINSWVRCYPNCEIIWQEFVPHHLRECLMLLG